MMQVDVQCPSEVERDGGAQQAILVPNRVLPWVPDLVGRAWRERGALLIVGSAYAPFVSGHASRGSQMRLQDYVEAGSWQAFQERFVAGVVRHDPSYYGQLALFSRATRSPSDSAELALFDLCRVSFVASDCSLKGDRAVREHCRIYDRYVVNSTNEEWLWRRLSETRALRIVALGSIAEHGLLRIFHRRGMSVAARGQQHVLKHFEDGKWVMRYADDARKIGFWTANQSWWTISGEHDGEQREWRLLPVLHPGAQAPRDQYRRELEVLHQMAL